MSTRTYEEVVEDPKNLYRKCQSCGMFFRHCFKFTYTMKDPNKPTMRFATIPTYWICPECAPKLEYVIDSFIKFKRIEE